MPSDPDISYIVSATELYCNNCSQCPKYDSHLLHKSTTNNQFLITFLVPQPTVEISTFPESGPFYAGGELSLLCTFQIDPVVDIPYTVRVDWQKSGVVLIGNDHVSVSNVTQLSTHVYLASVDLNPLSITSDTAIYTCRVTVDANPPLQYVQRAVHSDSVTITVRSKFVGSYVM